MTYDIDEIKRYAETHTMKDAVEKFDIYPSYLSRLSKTHCISFKKIERNKHIKDFILANCKEMSAREISERLGVSLHCVFYYARKLGVVCKKGCLKRKLFDRNEMIVCLVRNGFSYRSIADSFGVSFQRIEQIVNTDNKR